MVQREHELRRHARRETADATTWYEKADFTRSSLTKAKVGGGPADQAGLAMVIRCRIGAFVTIPKLVAWGRIPARFAGQCPFCGHQQGETVAHIIFDCARWHDARGLHLADWIVRVEDLGPPSSPGLDQTRLAWILGGSYDNRRVRGWLPPKPSATPPEENENAIQLADSDSEEDSVGEEGALGDPILDRELCGCLAVAKFLVSIVGLRANIIRSRWGNHVEHGSPIEVPPITAGQRPNG